MARDARISSNGTEYETWHHESEKEGGVKYGEKTLARYSILTYPFLMMHRLVAFYLVLAKTECAFHLR